jgi:hypothetical protein
MGEAFIEKKKRQKLLETEKFLLHLLPIMIFHEHTKGRKISPTKNLFLFDSFRSKNHEHEKLFVASLFHSDNETVINFALIKWLQLKTRGRRRERRIRELFSFIYSFRSYPIIGVLRRR